MHLTSTSEAHKENNTKEIRVLPFFTEGGALDDDDRDLADDAIAFLVSFSSS